MGPCSWDLSTVCCDTWDSYSVELQAQASAYASLVMWASTGRQFGLCELAVRPCGRYCEDSNGLFWDNGTWIPYIFSGVWRNCWCGLGSCSCAPACQVYLPGPVASITSVSVDGSVIDPATYRVDDQVWLVRTGTDNCWPLTQDFGVDPPTAGSFLVTYRRGVPPPTALLAAAGTLACEYAKACMGQACRLPSRVASVSRQGVSVTMADVNDLLKYGYTGLSEVDNVIRALNPNGLKGRTRFYSPDLNSGRVTTSP